MPNPPSPIFLEAEKKSVAASISPLEYRLCRLGYTWRGYFVAQASIFRPRHCLHTA
ncbi:unnamed protein product [Spirodela intermedia]|uniref:Uncharacterized protein n=1 Tax=Spirodela intermedia TaxID=51605 RepID=A0A7I8KZN0_SPIIN|nr:unnamed protein product [Spirodela intermedia]